MNGQLDWILGRFDATLRPRGPVTPLPQSSGASGAILFTFASARGAQVLKHWPRDRVDLARLEWAHARLSELRGLEFAALPWPALDGRSLVIDDGEAWELAPWKPGVALVDRPEAAHVRAAFRALGQVHARWRRLAVVGLSGDLEERFRELEALVAVGEPALRGPLEVMRPGPLRDRMQQLLSSAIRLAPRALERVTRFRGGMPRVQPCLRDTRAEHFLFVGDQLAGLVDFGAVGLDHVAVDLSRLLVDWTRGELPLWAEAIAAYREVADLDEEAIAWIEPFAWSLAALGGLRWLRWVLLEGRRFAPGLLEAGIERCLAREVTLREMEGRVGPGQL